MRESLREKARNLAEEVILNKLVPATPGYVDQKSIMTTREKF